MELFFFLKKKYLFLVTQTLYKQLNLSSGLVWGELGLCTVVFSAGSSTLQPMGQRWAQRWEPVLRSRRALPPTHASRISEMQYGHSNDLMKDRRRTKKGNRVGGQT